MKKLTVIVCILALLCGLSAAQAAEGSARLTCEGVNENGIAYVTVHLSGGITGDTMGIYYSYDPAVLEPVKSECHWVPKGILQDINVSRSEGVWAGSEAVKLDGEVCVLAFRVKSGATLTTSAVSCTLLVKNGADQVGEYQAAGEVKNACSHTYGAWEKQGELGHVHSCSLCGKSQTQSHTWDEGTVAADPVDPNRNIRTRTCTVCGGTKQEYEIVEPTKPEQKPIQTEPVRPEETNPIHPEPTVTEHTHPEPTPPKENRPEATGPEPTTPASGKPEPTAPGNSNPNPTAPGNSDPEPTAPGSNNPDPTIPGNSRPEATEPENPTPNTPQSGQIGSGSQTEDKPGQSEQSGQQSQQKPGQTGENQSGTQTKPSDQQNQPSVNTPQQGTIGPGTTAKPEQNSTGSQTSGGKPNEPERGETSEDSHDHEHEQEAPQSGLIYETRPEVLPAPGVPDTTIPVEHADHVDHVENPEEDSVIGPIVALLMLAGAAAGVVWYLRKTKK